jgi:hypothetical protein
MRWRGLLLCTLVVASAHGALIEALFGHELTRGRAPASEPGLPPRARLVLLDREQVAMLAMHRADALLKQVAAQTPARTSDPVAPETIKDADDASGHDDAQSLTARPATVVYRPPATLDQPVRPRSAPDLSMLSGLAWSGMPIRLRLFIDSRGVVVDTQVLTSNESDEVALRVRQMFLATGFTPGIVQGQPVPCYKDIEINIGSPA